MKSRTADYLKRKKAFQSLPLAADLRSLLKACYYSSKNLLVKRDVVRTYEEVCRKTGNAQA
jgi:hypothetical protein